MNVEHPCPSCRQPLQVPQEWIGRRIACPACKCMFLLRPANAPPAPPPPPPAFDDRPPPRRDYRDERDDHGRRGRRDEDSQDRAHWEGKAGTSNTVAIVACVLCWVPLVGIVLGIVAWSNASSDLGRLQSQRDPPSGVRPKFEQARNTALTGLIISAVLHVGCCLFPFLTW